MNRRLTATALSLGTILVLFLASSLSLAQQPGRAALEKRLAFAVQGDGFEFDTGVLRGQLHAKGKALGLTSVVYVPTGTPISGPYGLLSHYRLLDDKERYGKAAWDWKSRATLRDDGSVEVRWDADAEHPFDLAAVYRLVSADTIDVLTTIKAGKDLAGMEVFLASYFTGFPQSMAWSQAQQKPALVEARREAGAWQTFPRDDRAIKLYQDGRWKRPPSPVDWTMMPPLTAPLAIRRDAKAGLSAIFMAPRQDCFAISTPHGEEGHRSMYLSLLGQDLKAGDRAAARVRLIIGKDLDDRRAVELYEAFAKSLN